MTERQRPPGAVWWTVQRRPVGDGGGLLPWYARRSDWPARQARQFASQRAAYTWAFNMAIAAAQGDVIRETWARRSPVQARLPEVMLRDQPVRQFGMDTMREALEQNAAMFGPDPAPLPDASR